MRKKNNGNSVTRKKNILTLFRYIIHELSPFKVSAVYITATKTIKKGEKHSQK